MEYVINQKIKTIPSVNIYLEHFDNNLKYVGIILTNESELNDLIKYSKFINNAVFVHNTYPNYPLDYIKQMFNATYHIMHL